MGVITKRGAWLQFNGELIGQGRDAAIKEVTEKEDLRKRILDAVMAKQAEKNGETADTEKKDTTLD